MALPLRENDIIDSVFDDIGFNVDAYFDIGFGWLWTSGCSG